MASPVRSTESYTPSQDALDLVERAVEEALKLGASYAEARYHSRWGKSLSYRNDRPVGVGQLLEEGIALRVMLGGSMAFSATDELTGDAVGRLVEKTVAQARALENKSWGAGVSDETLARAGYRVFEKRRLEDLGLDEMNQMLRSVWGSVSKALSSARVAAFYQNLGWDYEYKYIVTSDGGRVESLTPRLDYFYNIAVAGDNGDMLNRWMQYGNVGGLEVWDNWRVEEEVVGEARVLEKILMEAGSPPSGKVDVVLGSEIVGLMVHESSGHPSEADRVLGREAAQAGKSFIKPDYRGTRVGSELVNISDDPTIPGLNGYYLFDDEAVPARKRRLYVEGRVNELLHNRWSAYMMGEKSNAAARALDHRSEPIVRMANTYFEPGDHTLEELLEGIREGIYMKTYMEWNIDDERWSQRYVGLEAYLVQSGEIRGMVRNPVLEATTPEIYGSIDAVGKDLRFYAGTCGKGEPGQPLPVSFGGPSVRARRLVIRRP